MAEPRSEDTTTDDLINRFIKGATDIGNVLDGSLKLRSEDPRYQAIVADMQTIGAELRKRMPMKKIRALYDHDSVAVRFWAAAQFMSVDPNWCEAAWGAIAEGISTVKAMELRQRAQTLPPERPTLQEMTIDQLIGRFEDACMRRYGARFLSDPNDENGGPDIEMKNRIISETVDIAEEIRGRNEGMRLVPYLDHSSDTVRFAAAVHCLPVVPERAQSIIEKIAASPDAEYFHEAGHTLDWWRKNRPA